MALATLLVRSGAVPPATLAAAERRCAVYGGTLDTALLELGALDERTLALHLAEATGWPAAMPGTHPPSDGEAHRCLGPAEARTLGVVPLRRGSDGTLKVIVHPSADRAAVLAWAADQRLALDPAVAPELRFRALWCDLYQQPLAPRDSVFLNRLEGTDELRRKAVARARAAELPAPPVDTGPRRRSPGSPELEPEPEIEIVEGAEASAEPAVESLVASLEAAREPAEVIRAIAALGSRGATQAVPLLIERLRGRKDVAAAAQAALVRITRQDFGASVRAWEQWWRKARQQHRVEWLLEALSHKKPELRLVACQELQALTGEYFGYHFDLPERDREEARRRWSEWWRTVGQKKLGESAR